MKRQLLVLGCATLALGAAWANITVGPGETLDWVENPPDPSEQIDCAGGAIIYSGDDNLVVSNVFSLSAATTFSVTGAGRVRFARKFLKPADAGCLVLDASVDFGSNDSATFAYLPENAIAFTPEAAAMPWTVTTTGETGGGTFNVVATESGVSLVVGSGGSVFIVR